MKFLNFIFIFIIYSKFTNCFIPAFFDDYNEEKDYLETRIDQIEIIPRIAESLFIQTVFLTDKDQVEPQQEKENLEGLDLENLAKLEQSVEQEQKNFIQNYVLHNTNTIETTQEPQFVFDKLSYLYDSSYIFIELEKNISKHQAEDLLKYIAEASSISAESLQDLSLNNNLVLFKLNSQLSNSTILISNILKHQVKILIEKNLNILSCGVAKDNTKIRVEKQKSESSLEYLIIFGTISFIILTGFSIIILGIYIFKKRYNMLNGSILVEKKGFDDEERLLEKQEKKVDNKLNSIKDYIPFLKSKKDKEMTPNQDYKDLCRQRMQSKVSPINSTICTTVNVNDTTTPGLNIVSPAISTGSSNTINSTPIRITGEAKVADSSRNSTWLEESMNSLNIDITTGHVILAYMEKNFNDKNLLDEDWNYLTEYEADFSSTKIALKNLDKNKHLDILPYDYSLVRLKQSTDYINASYIIDDDPKNPAYIATQSPIENTITDFWQMIWENQTVLIVNLENTSENQYWPDTGFKIFDKFEVHFASEHSWNEDFLVRNFFFKNLDSNQTRTITQFQYLTWTDNQLPSIRSLLDFRKKVNKSYTSKTCPIVVHCDDGVGKTGTYIMIDMVLHKISKGAKEIDLAATVEFLRDQRPQMIKLKSQYEFSFQVITEEVKNILNSLGQ